MRRLGFILVLLLISRAGADTITVSAAISLKESLEQIAKSYEAQSHDHVQFNFDASGKLAAQIRQGAPVDLFISADDEQMQKLIDAKCVDEKSQRVIVDNNLVLIAPAAEKNPPARLADLPHTAGKIAIGEPKTVPAGHYAMQSFKHLQLDTALSPRLVFGESVRQVLTYVEEDEVTAGIVYSTDAKEAGEKVKVITTIAADTHDRIEYPAALVSGCAHPTAGRGFLDYLTTESARKIFTDHGFQRPTTPSHP